MRISGYQATGTAIQNPFTFYYVNNNDWSSSHSYQFWNKNFTSDPGITNAATAKTIYSPSPSGYVEPKTAAFTGFTSNGANTQDVALYNVSGPHNKGLSFYTNGWKTGTTLFFPALGHRDQGSVINVGLGSAYWASGASSVSFGRGFGFDMACVLPQHGDDRSYGFISWPVHE